MLVRFCLSYWYGYLFLNAFVGHVSEGDGGPVDPGLHAVPPFTLVVGLCTYSFQHIYVRSLWAIQNEFNTYFWDFRIISQRQLGWFLFFVCCILISEAMHRILAAFKQPRAMHARLRGGVRVHSDVQRGSPGARKRNSAVPEHRTLGFVSPCVWRYAWSSELSDYNTLAN